MGTSFTDYIKRSSLGTRVTSCINVVHGIDGQLMNELNLALDWSIGVHDAVIVHPADAMKVRANAVKLMKELHNNGTQVVNAYLKSVGIKKDHRWLEIAQLIDSREDVNITADVLK